MTTCNMNIKDLMTTCNMNIKKLASKRAASLRIARAKTMHGMYQVAITNNILNLQVIIAVLETSLDR